MSRVLVLIKYRCQHVEYFRIGQDEVRLLDAHLRIDQESGKKCLSANSIECHQCHLSSYVTMERDEFELNDPYSSLSTLPPSFDLYEWYMDLMDELQDEDRVAPEASPRLLWIFARDVVYLHELSEIKRFFRQVCEAHDVEEAAELSEALLTALTNKTIQQRLSFWEELHDALQVSNMQPLITRQGSEESECSKMIHGLASQLREETSLLLSLTCEYPVGAMIPHRAAEAMKKWRELEPVVTKVFGALCEVLDSMHSLNFDHDDSEFLYGEVSKIVASGRFLTVALYQSYSRQKAVLWRLATDQKRERMGIKNSGILK